MGAQTIYLILENVGYDDTSLGTFLPSALGGIGPGQITYVSISYDAISSSATINTVKSYGGYTINGLPLNAGKQIWAPISAGTPNYILTSGGTGAPTWKNKFNFEQVVVPSNMWSNITVNDLVVGTTSVMSIHFITCTYPTGAAVYFYPMRSTSATTISDFSDVASLVYSNNHAVGACGNYNGRIVYGASSTGSTFYLLGVA